ncbi:putative lipid II flippase FtsW [Zhihengliuella flava]|uniref:Probable peptidoglycan glycosyltransferase FtsW n=1 Tax=Zhihengliuella flava TaxID=1285193 RepID=A0A931DBY9_9MICC|nr:putative lipid II flippase FtsW [Zhihengliuella flava]MBG6085632.1 cell division protein FtsW [Zhihengliuella flava]
MTRFWRLLEGSDGARNGGYYLILGSTLAMTAIGLLMVLSSSSVSAISHESNSYGLFLRQGVFAVVGVIGMLVLARIPASGYRKLAWPILGVAILGLLLVLTPLGVTVNGNRNWIEIAGFRGQPSEAAKLALAIWGAHVLATKRHLISDWKHALVPVVIPGAAIICLFVLLGHDVGTLLVIVLVVVAILFLAGAPLRLFIVGGVLGLVGMVAVFTMSDNRMQRLNAWLQVDCDVNPTCYQPMHGFYALASGGWWGVGLGQSRQKWNYLPEGQTDYILAIIGEELGFIGTLVIVVLFAVLAIAMYRVAVRSQDPFIRVATGGIMAWIIGQAFINMGMVTGLLPVIGIPLPFISYGGSALVISLAAIGVVLSFARQSAAEAASLPPQRKNSPSS